MARKEGSRDGRTNRLADHIHRQLAVLIQRELKDPRLGLITVNEVRVSRDLAWADVYFTALGGAALDGAEDGPTEVLQHAAGFLRSELARIMDTRVTPQLRFHYDNSLEDGMRMSRVINAAVASDTQKSGPRDTEPDDDGGNR
ncbi:MAG: ribosome-binding factor A [Gammaproteobacteria bacterium]|nr:ribosome-binding factor A [Gammaproteobacteria bacterium]